MWPLELVNQALIISEPNLVTKKEVIDPFRIFILLGQLCCAAKECGGKVFYYGRLSYHGGGYK